VWVIRIWSGSGFPSNATLVWIFYLVTATIILLFSNRNCVALDGNPEPDLVHATGCKQPTLRFWLMLCFKEYVKYVYVEIRMEGFNMSNCLQ
jgi:hypothetical protein